MSAHLILEVISGPMDGLKSTISDRPAGIGRGVGNTLTLPLDMHVSRSHACVTLEGHDWCLRQTGGKTGTWLSGKKLEPGVGYPLSTGHVILMGTTIIDVRVTPSVEPNIVLTGDCFLNPPEQFDIAPDLTEIWDALTNNCPQRYIGIDDILNTAMPATYDIQRYTCISEISSKKNIKCLGRWLLDFFPCALKHKIDGNTLLITPRLLKVITLAGEKISRPVDLMAFIDAVTEEGGSLPARYMLKDKNFMQDFPELMPAASHPVEKNVTENEQVTDIGSVEVPDIENPVLSNLETDTIDLIPNDTEVLLRSLRSFETLVLGFLEDAAGHRTSGADFFLPGYTKRLMAVYADGYKKELDAYVDDLYRILVGIMAAQRDAAREVETEIHHRLKKVLKGVSNKNTNRIFKKINPDAISETVLSVLKETELEQLADRRVREKIKQLLDPPVRAGKTANTAEHQ